MFALKPLVHAADAGGKHAHDFEREVGALADHEEEGRTIEQCDPLFGDHLEKQVTWKGETTIGVPPDKDFTLRFDLRAAKLYSFELR